MNHFPDHDGRARGSWFLRALLISSLTLGLVSGLTWAGYRVICRQLAETTFSNERNSSDLPARRSFLG